MLWHRLWLRGIGLGGRSLHRLKHLLRFCHDARCRAKLCRGSANFIFGDDKGLNIDQPTQGIHCAEPARVLAGFFQNRNVFIFGHNSYTPGP